MSPRQQSARPFMQAASLLNDSASGALAHTSPTRATVRAVHDVFQAFEARSRDARVDEYV